MNSAENHASIIKEAQEGDILKDATPRDYLESVLARSAIILKPHQREFIDACFSHHCAVWSAPRRAGKTTACAVLSACLLLAGYDVRYSTHGYWPGKILFKMIELLMGSCCGASTDEYGFATRTLSKAGPRNRNNTEPTKTFLIVDEVGSLRRCGGISTERIYFAFTEPTAMLEVDGVAHAHLTGDAAWELIKRMQFYKCP